MKSRLFSILLLIAWIPVACVHVESHSSRPELTEPPSAAATAVVTPIPPSPPAVSAAAAAPTEISKDIHWFRNSAEYRACMIQAYRTAGRQLESLTTGLQPGTWAVALDADETIIDNSEYQKEQFLKGKGFSPEDWTVWCLRKEAKALPGAATFLGQVQKRGGKVVIVTNRSDREQAATEENLRSEKIPYDLILCKTTTGEKEPRWEAVEKGTAAPGVPPLKIVMWVGDNIRDFPNLSQALRAEGEEAFSNFGARYIVLPNPMYGSWERNPKN